MEIAYSQVCPIYLKSVLTNEYNLPSIVNVTYLHQGLNDTYKVETVSEPYILRIYRHNWKSYGDIMGELELIHLLRLNEIMVSYPIADRASNLIHSLICPEGTRYFVLFSFAPGEGLPSLDVETAKLFGEQLARIHRITENKQIDKLSKSYNLPDILAFAKSTLKARLGRFHSSLNQLSRIEQILEERLHLDLLKHLTQGVCHGDPHHENCFVDIRKRELTFFDFDFCGNGYLHYDIGSFFHYERHHPAAQKSFLEGYTEVKPLSDVEVFLIPYFTILMRIFHLGARTKNADGIKNPLWPVREIDKTISEIGHQLDELNTI
ncbi:MAG: phosphotransferase [Bacteroidota bacterium]